MTSTYKREGFVNDSSTYIKELVARRAEQEAAEEALIERLADLIAEAGDLWNRGDSRGGYLWARLEKAVWQRRPDLVWEPRPGPAKVKGPCAWCGQADGCHRDHIVPRSRGGGDWKPNRRWLCPRCNAFKGRRLDEEIPAEEMARHLADRAAVMA